MKILHNHLDLTTALILLIMGTGCGHHASEATLPPDESAGESAPQLVDVTEAKRLIAARQVTILDVRTPDEFSAGHIAGAKNLNFYGGDFQAKLQQLDKDQSYLVHCASGARSARASAAMSRLGFKSVYDLAGGIRAWEQAHQEVVK
jgi:rhodanese-related sulfurtransferase